jgi:hypothetical protein
MAGNESHIVSKMREGRTGRGLIAGLLVVWGASVALGFVVLMDYQNAPGAPAEPPSQWPASSALDPGGQTRGTLVLFAHPRCPCTRATLSELERLLHHVQGRVTTYVVFVQPEGYDRAWVRDHLWHRATAMPAVRPVRDVKGMEAERFGAFTSGQVLYYDEQQHLRFAGGITGARGHEGDNKGRQALRQLIQTGTANRTSTFVFGCALHRAPMNRWKSLQLSSAPQQGSSPHEHEPHPSDTIR